MEHRRHWVDGTPYRSLPDARAEIGIVNIKIAAIDDFLSPPNLRTASTPLPPVGMYKRVIPLPESIVYRPSSSLGRGQDIDAVGVKRGGQDGISLRRFTLTWSISSLCFHGPNGIAQIRPSRAVALHARSDRCYRCRIKAPDNLSVVATDDGAFCSMGQSRWFDLQRLVVGGSGRPLAKICWTKFQVKSRYFCPVRVTM